MPHILKADEDVIGNYFPRNLAMINIDALFNQNPLAELANEGFGTKGKDKDG